MQKEKKNWRNLKKTLANSNVKDTMIGERGGDIITNLE
jgi:hypothetical protein